MRAFPGTAMRLLGTASCSTCSSSLSRCGTLVCCLLALDPPVAERECWRPTIDDVDRISWGRNAKQKGTGSRGVPHRLNDEERVLYDAARSKGFVEIAGSGWRRQRSASPLVNTYRSWCDARGVPAIYVHKGKDGSDEVVVDLAPLRTPTGFEAAAAFCLGSVPGAADGAVEAEQWAVEAGAGAAGAGGEGDAEESGGSGGEDSSESGGKGSNEEGGVDGGVGGSTDGEDKVEGDGLFRLSELAEAYLRDPIYRLPMYAVAWQRLRPEAKTLAKELASALGTAETSGGVAKGRRKARGAPEVKPGKSRRHGGYGIG
jgi:hypothetical protein